jgi:hypothetical protein
VTHSVCEFACHGACVHAYVRASACKGTRARASWVRACVRVFMRGDRAHVCACVRRRAGAGASRSAMRCVGTDLARVGVRMRERCACAGAGAVLARVGLACAHSVSAVRAWRGTCTCRTHRSRSSILRTTYLRGKPSHTKQANKGNKRATHEKNSESKASQSSCLSPRPKRAVDSRLTLGAVASARWLILKTRQAAGEERSGKAKRHGPAGGTQKLERKSIGSRNVVCVGRQGGGGVGMARRTASCARPAT